MATRSKCYFVRLANGERVPLHAGNREAAIVAALGHFGASLEAEDPQRTAFSWELRIRQMIGTSSAERWQVEAIKRYRGVGDATCNALCELAGRARIEDVLGILRGKSRIHAGDIFLILNRRSEALLPQLRLETQEGAAMAGLDTVSQLPEHRQC